MRAIERRASSAEDCISVGRLDKPDEVFRGDRCQDKRVREGSHATGYRGRNSNKNAYRRQTSYDGGKPKNFAQFVPPSGQHDAPLTAVKSSRPVMVAWVIWSTLQLGEQWLTNV